MLTRIPPDLPVAVLHRGGTIEQRLAALEVEHGRLMEAIATYIDRLNQKGSLAIMDRIAFDPTLYGDSVAGTQTYALQEGLATILDYQLAFVEGVVTLSAKGGTMAGNVLLGGLPFTTRTSGQNGGAVAVGLADSVNLTAGYAQVALVVPSAGDFLRLVESGDNVATQFVGDAAIANDTRISFAGWMHIN